MNAQVAIGAGTGVDNGPHSGAVLELDGSKGGLLLPKVSITDAGIFQLAGNEEDGIGMLVYNTNETITGGYGKGVYVWDGENWNIVNRQGGFDDEFNPGDYDTEVPGGFSAGLAGIFCFDIREPLTTFTYDYPLTITGTYSKKEVIWAINDGNSIQDAPAVTGSANAHLTFKPQTTGQILLTAHIALTQGETVHKFSISKTIKFQLAACCAGYIVEQGAYTGTIPTQAAPGLSVEQTLALFPFATKKTLCVGPDLGASLTWNAVAASGWCNTILHNIGGVWNDGNNDWRLPNIAELANLQAVKSSVPDLSTSYNYWSSTIGASSPTYYAAVWNFYEDGKTDNFSKTSSQPYTSTRCVRSMD
jgi:hypothetical protein